MTVLLDTNALIYSLSGSESLTPAAARVLADPDTVKVCSQAALWEMTIKYALGKLPLPEPPGDLWRRLIRVNPSGVLIITPEHLDRLAGLPHHHRDPFDRLMIAQALEEDWEVISSDDQWDAYGVTRIW